MNSSSIEDDGVREMAPEEKKALRKKNLFRKSFDAAAKGSGEIYNLGS